jgi:sugar phosphate isomerase/epimerase
MRMMTLGLGTYAYMWSIGFPGAHPEKPLGALDLLLRAREFGVKLVQIGPNLPLERLSPGDLNEIAERAQKWGIQIELATRGLETQHLTGQLALCERLGAKLLRTIPELDDGRVPAREEMAERLHSIAPALAVSKVKLALENGKIPAEVLRQVLEAIASPWVGITLDTVNSLAIPEGWRQVATILAPYTMCLHVKDFVVQRLWHMMGFLVEGRPAGRGQLDIPWLLNTLKSASASPSVILEVWPPEQKSLEETITLEHSWVCESIPYLRRFIPG